MRLGMLLVMVAGVCAGQGPEIGRLMSLVTTADPDPAEIQRAAEAVIEAARREPQLVAVPPGQMIAASVLSQLNLRPPAEIRAMVDEGLAAAKGRQIAAHWTTTRIYAAQVMVAMAERRHQAILAAPYVAALAGLKPAGAGERATVAYLRGQFAEISGKDAAALKFYREAAELEPESALYRRERDRLAAPKQ